MSINEIRNLAIFGFNAETFLTGVYNNDEYLAVLTNGKICLASKNPINNNSKESYGCYYTYMDINELSDVNQCSISARYRGNVYKVAKIGSNLQDLCLLARKENKNEDLALGFVDDFNERMTYKIVTPTEIEDISIDRVSVYEELKSNFQKSR